MTLIRNIIAGLCRRVLNWLARPHGLDDCYVSSRYLTVHLSIGFDALVALSCDEARLLASNLEVAANAASGFDLMVSYGLSSPSGKPLVSGPVGAN